MAELKRATRRLETIAEMNERISRLEAAIAKMAARLDKLEAAPGGRKDEREGDGYEVSSLIG